MQLFRPPFRSAKFCAEPTVLSNRGFLRFKLKDWAFALADFNATLALIPKKSALIRASCPDAKYRDARKAYDDAKPIGYLAMAYAEAGQLDDAVKLQKQALENPAFAGVNGDTLREQLKLYEQKKPYRLPEK